MVAPARVSVSGDVLRDLIDSVETLDGERAAAALGPFAADDILRARRGRDRFLRPRLFGEPGWDMLLDLYVHAARGYHRVSVSSLCIAAAVPPTTALSWIGRMVEAGDLRRTPDPRDGRCSFVTLGDETAHALDLYFAWLGRAS